MKRKTWSWLYLTMAALTLGTVSAYTYSPKVKASANQTQEAKKTTDDSAETTTGNWDGCPWKAVGDTLTIGKTGQSYDITEPTRSSSPFPNHNGDIAITHVKIQGAITLPSDSSGLFVNMGQVADITGLDNLDTANVTDMNNMFRSDNKLTALDLSNFNTSHVATMYGMFSYDYNFMYLDLSSFDMSNVADTSLMFREDRRLWQLKLSNKFSKFGLDTLPDHFPGDFVSDDDFVRTATGQGWQAVGAGTVDDPKGHLYTDRRNFADEWPVDGEPDPETYVWPMVLTPRIDLSTLNVKDEVNLTVGDHWQNEDGFISATDRDGNAVDFDKIKISIKQDGQMVDSVDTSKTGTYDVTYTNDQYAAKPISETTKVVIKDRETPPNPGATPSPTPSPQPTPNPAPTPQPAPTPTEPTTPSAPPVKPMTPNKATKHQAAIYAVKGIYLYKHATFNKDQRIAKYPKQKRIHRPMFIVVDYARSNGGALRYKVRDVNAGTKAAGKVGYITANQKYVQSAYYQTMPKNNRIRVISLKGIHAYKNQNLTGRAKAYKKGTRLTVKKIVKHNLTTRYQLKNGLYITGNKKLIIHDQY